MAEAATPARWGSRRLALSPPPLPTPLRAPRAPRAANTRRCSRRRNTCRGRRGAFKGFDPVQNFMVRGCGGRRHGAKCSRADTGRRRRRGACRPRACCRPPRASPHLFPPRPATNAPPPGLQPRQVRLQVHGRPDGARRRAVRHLPAELAARAPLLLRPWRRPPPPHARGPINTPLAGTRSFMIHKQTNKRARRPPTLCHDASVPPALARLWRGRPPPAPPTARPGSNKPAASLWAQISPRHGRGGPRCPQTWPPRALPGAGAPGPSTPVAPVAPPPPGGGAPRLSPPDRPPAARGPAPPSSALAWDPTTPDDLKQTFE
jgi:hypothetical protein